MATIVKTDTTLFRPVMIGLRSPRRREDYLSSITVNSRTEWSPMASHLDWSSVADFDEFEVVIRYAEYVETRKESKHTTYNGRRDTRQVAGGGCFERVLCAVTHGKGKHKLYIQYSNGKEETRIISEAHVVKAVRLFLSSQYLRRALDILVGPDVWDEPAHMIIKPI